MKTNPKPWLYGPNWQGQRLWPERAGARRASGLQSCLRGAARCTAAGSTGPKTEDGLVRLTAARSTHGKYTKEKRAEARRRAKQGRQMWAELKELEAWFVDHGHLDKNWRDQFK